MHIAGYQNIIDGSNRVLLDQIMDKITSLVLFHVTLEGVMPPSLLFVMIYKDKVRNIDIN